MARKTALLSYVPKADLTHRGAKGWIANREAGRRLAVSITKKGSWETAETYVSQYCDEERPQENPQGIDGFRPGKIS
jgi:hypothetical protein